MSDKDTPQTPPHAKDDEAARVLEQEHARRRRHDELLDEGVEESFPASDPVAVKHIT